MRLRGGNAITVYVQLYDSSTIKVECVLGDSVLKVKKMIYGQNQELSVDYMDLIIENE